MKITAPRTILVFGALLLATASPSCDKDSGKAKPDDDTKTDPDKQKPSTSKAVDKTVADGDKGGDKAASDLLEKPIERRLHPGSVEASSFLWTDWNRFQENYHPHYIADDDPATAWVEGADNSGAGEWIRLAVSEVKHTTNVRLRLRNGYQKSKSLFDKNARAKEVELVTLPGKHTKTFTLTDTMDWQELSFDQPDGPLDGIELRIKSVYPGKKYKDLCISDVEVFVTGRTPDNPAFEKQRLERLLAWKQARLALAEAHKKGGSKLPIYTSYKVTSDDTNRPKSERNLPFLLRHIATMSPAHKDTADAAIKAIESKFKGWIPAQMVVKPARKLPEVDGLTAGWPEEIAYGEPRKNAFMLPVVPDRAVLTGVGVSLFDEKRKLAPTEYSALEPPFSDRKCPRNKTLAWRPPGKQGPKLSHLYVVHCTVVSERESEYVQPAWQLWSFDDDGRLSMIVARNYAQTFDWSGKGPDAKVNGGKRVTFYTDDTLSRPSKR